MNDTFDKKTIISIIALLLSALSLLYAHNANQLAVEANNIASEANTLSAQANEVSSKLVTATIKAEEIVVSTGYYTCKNPYNNHYYLFLAQDGKAILTNTGGLSTSLTRVELTNVNYDWVEFVTNEDLTEIVELPIDIPAGTSKKVNFVALYLAGYGETPEDANATKLPEPEEYRASPLWKVYFGNGQSGELYTYSSLIDLFVFSPEIFERNCIHPHPWNLP